MFWAWNFHVLNNLLSYSGLVDTRISASDKDLPVLEWQQYFLIRDGRKNVDTSTWKPSECPLWATVLHSWALLHIWPCQSVTVPFFSQISRPKLSKKNWSWRSHRKKKRFPFFFSVDPRTLLLIIVLPQNHWCIGTKNIQYWGQNFFGSCVWKKEATI